MSGFDNLLASAKTKTPEEFVRECSERSHADKNSMRFWFPKIEAAGLPVPKTIMFEMPDAAQVDAWRLIDNAEPNGEFAKFCAMVATRAAEIGFPLFVRTGTTSGKHDWDTTCNVQSADVLKDHIFSLIYFSECCELAWDVIALREFLPTMPVGKCPRYTNMPVCKEFRFFAEDGEVKCSHPYWPRYALEQGGFDIVDANYEALCACPDIAELTDIAARASKACGGAWSVDLLETKRGWFLTDMALAAASFHWDGCKANESSP